MWSRAPSVPTTRAAHRSFAPKKKRNERDEGWLGGRERGKEKMGKRGYLPSHPCCRCQRRHDTWLRRRNEVASSATPGFGSLVTSTEQLTSGKRWRGGSNLCLPLTPRNEQDDAAHNPKGSPISWGSTLRAPSSAQEPVATVGPTGGRPLGGGRLSAFAPCRRRLGNPRTPRFLASWTTVMGRRGTEKNSP